jgi:NADPH:quinone reductase-like Zn-dependent oxidoreductase
VAKKPSTWSFEDTASLGCVDLSLPFGMLSLKLFYHELGLMRLNVCRVSFITALMALGSGLKPPLPFLKDGPTTDFRPSSVLILGGSSALGAATIQLLRLAVPGCKILVTSSPKHYSHLNSMGADTAIDRSSTTLVADVKSATPGSRGVDGIIDAVGAGSTERHVFDAFDPNGPKKYAQVWTGADEIEVPGGVDSVLFRSRDVVKLQGGGNVTLALQTLLEEGKYKLPLPTRKVGEGLDGLKKALDLVRKGVSGEKLVVSI